MPRNLLEILCLTQVFEKRTLKHFKRHLGKPGVHPAIREALQKMIDDEEGHISWVREELDAYAKEHGEDAVEDVLEELEAIDQKVYERLLAQAPFDGYFAEDEE